MSADACLKELRDALVGMQPARLTEAEAKAEELRHLVPSLNAAEAACLAPQLANLCLLAQSACALLGQSLEVSGAALTGYTAYGVAPEWHCGPVLRA